MRIIVFFIFIFSLFIFASCDLPEPVDGKAIVVINFGGGGNGRAVVLRFDESESPESESDETKPPFNPVPSSWGFNKNSEENLGWEQLQFVITMSGGPGRQPATKDARYDTDYVSFVVDPGTWDIFVGVFYDDINRNRHHLFDGSILGYTIKAGYNEIDQDINLELPEGALFVGILENNQTLSPLAPFDTFDIAVAVAGFLNDEDARDFRLRMVVTQNVTPGADAHAGIDNIDKFVWLDENDENDGPASNGKKTFNLTGDWSRNDPGMLTGGDYRLDFVLYNIHDTEESDFEDEGRYHRHESVKFNAVYLKITDGIVGGYPIPVIQDNIIDFIDYIQNDTYNLRRSYRLETDIDLSKVERFKENWTPIGTSSTPYKGIFDGNGKKISNLTITGSGDVGLFGVIKNSETATEGRVKNIWLDNCTITGDGNVGGIAGSIETADAGGSISSEYCATVKNCFVSGIVKGQGNVGGIVGLSSGGIITNCYSNVTVSADPPAAEGKFGGILGKAEPITVGSTEIKSVVEYCYAKRSVSGGLVGSEAVGTTISNCVKTVPPPPAEYSNKENWIDLGFKFGTNEGNPWKWGSNLPILWFVTEVVTP